MNTKSPWHPLADTTDTFIHLLCRQGNNVVYYTRETKARGKKKYCALRQNTGEMRGGKHQKEEMKLADL